MYNIQQYYTSFQISWEHTPFKGKICRRNIQAVRKEEKQETNDNMNKMYDSSYKAYILILQDFLASTLAKSKKMTTRKICEKYFGNQVQTAHRHINQYSLTGSQFFNIPQNLFLSCNLTSRNLLKFVFIL